MSARPVPREPTQAIVLLREMYTLILNHQVALVGSQGGVWTWPDRAKAVIDAAPPAQELSDDEIMADIRRVWRELTHASNVDVWPISASEIAIYRAGRGSR